MARQQILIEDLIRQEEARFIDAMGNLEAQRSAERNAEREINTAIANLRETVRSIYPNVPLNELNKHLSDTRLSLRRKVRLEQNEG